MATRFVPNPAFKAELRRTPVFRKGTAEITVKVAESVKTAALPFRHTGHYIRSVKPRGSRVYLEPSVAHIIELGSVNNPPQANVRRGVKAAGLRFEDAGPHQAD